MTNLIVLFAQNQSGGEWLDNNKWMLIGIGVIGLIGIFFMVIFFSFFATAVIAAHKAGIELPWRTAAAIDLAGRDVLDAVKTSVNPKVIDCPDPSKGRPTLDGVCKNGIQLRAKARVTVRTKLDRLVGGATEETIIALSAKASSRPSVPLTTTPTCSPIPTLSRRPC